jgi:CubicO group peptidase (beta-lactamase class C family)
LGKLTLNKRFLSLWLVALLAVLLSLGGGSLSRADNPAGYSYTWQADDSLSRLAEKYYHDAAAWPAIIIATNSRVEWDDHFERILSPGGIQVGQRLWLPEPAQLEQLRAESPQPQPFTAERLAEFEQYIDSARQRYQIPGAVVLLIHGQEIMWAKGFGERELGRPEPVDPNTVFAVGSVTKAMTSMLVATMVDDGLLEWDQPVQEIWPDFTLSDPNRAAQLRLRDMFTMATGLPRRDLVWSGAELTAEQLMESLAQLPVYGEIGQHFEYNNQVVSTGGYVAALAAGGSYGQLDQAYSQQLRQRIFEPIDMQSATTAVEQVLANPNHATPHDYNLSGEVSPTHFHASDSITPAGGVYTSGLDLARFVLTQMNGGVSPAGQRVVSAHNLAETHRSHTPVTASLSYGMGWYIEQYRGVELLWHDGNVFGFKAQMAMVPAADIGLVVLSNSIMSITFNAGVQYRLVELLFGLPPEAEAEFDRRWAAFEQAIAEINGGVSPAVDPPGVTKFAGDYGDNWRVELREDQLYAVRGPYEWQLLPAVAEADKFIVNNGYGIGLDLFLRENPDTGQITMSFTLPTGEMGNYERVGP